MSLSLCLDIKKKRKDALQDQLGVYLRRNHEIFESCQTMLIFIFISVKKSLNGLTIEG